ncbi:MAG: hypothetical protein R3F65_19755 [bacterium]
MTPIEALAAVERDPAALRTRARDGIDRARAAGRELALVGYDANGIQAFVTRGSLLDYLRGASAQVKAFDRAQQGRPGNLFAAGGRGRFLVPRREAEAWAKALVDDYRCMTHGEVLATAWVPYAADAERATLDWLADRLAAAKDAAPPPDDAALGAQWTADACPVCRRRPVAPGAEYTYGKEAPLPVCRPCAQITHSGKKAAGEREERGKTLSDLSPTNRIAVLAADGNQMGELFGSLADLEESVVASRAVAALFEGTLERALAGFGLLGREVVTPVVGGDDIRLFVGPEHIFAIVITLVAELERLADAWAGALGLDRLGTIGVGVGLVIGPETHPASLAIEQAHRLEDSAKRLCKRAGFRSAIDFIHLRSGDELMAGGVDARHPRGISHRDGRRSPFAVDVDAGERLAAMVPASQRAQMYAALNRAGRGHADAEVANLLRYQVARSDEWRAWFDAIGEDWRDFDAYRSGPVSHARLEIARIRDVIERKREPR